jgi:hypothetical protein
MCHQNQHTSLTASLTDAYEQQALDAFRQWYRQTHPTIRDADLHVSAIARETVEGLTPTQVIRLLAEHPEWTHRFPPDIAYNQTCLTVGEATRQHLVTHLQQVLQQRGLEGTADPDA